MPTSRSNQRIRQSYTRAREYVKRSQDRRLTQREFLDTVFGNNPKTGKPYNDRTLRKWLKNERNADIPVARAERGGGTFNVAFNDPNGKIYSVNIDNTLGSSRLDIYTPTRQNDFKRTAKKALEERYVTPVGQPPSLPKPGESPTRLKTTRRLKPIGIKPVRHAKRTVILRKHTKAA